MNQIEHMIDCFVTLEQERLDQVELIQALIRLKRKRATVPASWIPALKSRIRILERQIDELGLDAEMKKFHLEYCLSQSCADSKYVYWAFVYGNHIIDHHVLTEQECTDLACQYMNMEWISCIENVCM
jgi:hypothetical protein